MQYQISAYAPGLHKQFTVAHRVYDIKLTDHIDRAARDESSTASGHASDVSLRFETLDDNCVRIANGCAWPFSVEGHTEGLNPGERLDVQLPTRLWGNSIVLAASRPLDYEALCRGCENDFCDIAASDRAEGVPQSVVPAALSPASATLVQWFKTLGRIQRQAVCSDAFYREAVRAVIEPGGLDTGMLLERAGGGGWDIKFSRFATPCAPISFEPHLAELVHRRREPLLYQPPSKVPFESTALFAAPVFDHEMNVAFVLFGQRQCGANNRRRRLRELEWLWIQLIAETLSAGFVGSNQRSTIARQQELLQRVCPANVFDLTGSVAGELISQTREVTVAFIDLVDSTRLCEQHAEDQFLRFQSELMEQWSSIVEQHGGRAHVANTSRCSRSCRRV